MTWQGASYRAFIVISPFPPPPPPLAPGSRAANKGKSLGRKDRSRKTQRYLRSGNEIHNTFSLNTLCALSNPAICCDAFHGHNSPCCDKFSPHRGRKLRQCAWIANESQHVAF